ncbi:MAG: hypothetical protein U0790_27060 [Isosphaeraceae bacterium]
MKPLVNRLEQPGSDRGRSACALGSVDAIGTAGGRAAIREALRDPSPGVRVEQPGTATSTAARRRRALARLLDDRDAAARREAAAALGRLGDRAAILPLMDHLADPDRFAAWSIPRRDPQARKSE